MRTSISKKLLCTFYSFSILLVFVASFTGCSRAFNATQQYPKEKLQDDYRLFRNILEDAHPSLYWYTTKDSLDYYFDEGYRRIADSMTEPQFRTLLSYTISKIDCGHTSVRSSKKYSKYIDTARLPQFPLGIKFWDDSAVVYTNLDRHSLLIRGTMIKAINHTPINVIRDSLFQYMVMDGYSTNHKYQSLSNLGNFGGLYQSVYGANKLFNIDYVDSTGAEKNTTITLYDIRTDTAYNKFLHSFRKTTKKERKRNALFNTRNIQVDTTGSTAYMTVTTFSNGNKLKSFFRSSFRLLDDHQIKNLIIDVRTNGGGNVELSGKLTQYIINHRFKLADSLYAIRRLSSYEKYIQNTLPAFFFMNFVTKKRSDGMYHFGYFERHYFTPKSTHHFNGNVYILTGGNSFSATTLFANALKGQSNVKLVGEETGGGAYGNTAWFIPDATLPNTHVRFRLPRFHMVMNRNFPKNGRGIIPDIEVKPSTEAIRRGYDVKMEFVKKLIDSTKVNGVKN